MERHKANGPGAAATALRAGNVPLGKRTAPINPSAAIGATGPVPALTMLDEIQVKLERQHRTARIIATIGWVIAAILAGPAAGGWL